MAAAAAAQYGLPALSGLFGGLASAGQSATTQAENYAMEKRAQALAEAQNADALSRQTQTNPLRDQAIYALSGMLGVSPQAFNPTTTLSPTNTGTQGTGGVNLNALASRMGAYTPGAGGVTSNVQQMILNRLGYGNVPTGTLYDNPSTPADKLSNAPTAASTTGAGGQGGAGAPGGAAKTDILGMPNGPGVEVTPGAGPPGSLGTPQTAPPTPQTPFQQGHGVAPTATVGSGATSGIPPGVLAQGLPSGAAPTMSAQSTAPSASAQARAAMLARLGISGGMPTMAAA